MTSSLMGAGNSKIFGIGLGRTGSRSLARAMHLLGYSVKHGIRAIDDIHKFDFVNDIFVSSRYEFLDYAFPEALFILTTRDMESWLKSCRQRDIGWEKKQRPTHEDGKPVIPLWQAEQRFRLYKTIRFDDALFRKAYDSHVHSVITYFTKRYSDPSAKLLSMNITGGEGWERLCPFLGKDDPNVPFPHLHKSS